MSKAKLQAAIAELKEIRKQQAFLAEVNKRLREYIKKHGGNASPYPDHTERNKAIYKEWKQGKSIKDLSGEHGLSTGSVASICRRLEKISNS